MQKKADFAGLSKEFDIDPLMVRLLVNRGVNTSETIHNYLASDKDYFHDPFLLKDMEKAVDAILKGISDDKHIRVVGDYDVDGVSAATILTKGLKHIVDVNKSKAIIDTKIPHRVKDGYGLSINIIEDAYKDNVDIILTCDNGISAFLEVKRANELGITVVITDHHEVPFKDNDGVREYIIPEAYAIVDPKQPDCSYPFEGICGAFVAYKLILAITKKLGIDKEYLDELYELAGLATVADIMELKDENRPLVKHAMLMMKNSHNLGLRALIDVTGIHGADITTYHLGFVIGPCINASGRVDSADRALELLLSEDIEKAVVLANDLKVMNDSRKKLTELATQKAISIINDNAYDKDKVLVVYIEDCHESVAGIVAGRLKERYDRPALVITKAENDVKGSGRSVEAYNLYEEMTKVSDIFTKYGGHSQAAGFSLSENRIDELRERLNDNCSLSFRELEGVLKIDADAPFSYCSERFVSQLDLMAPTGNGNEGCVFARKDVEIISARFFGSEGKVGKYKVRDTDGIVSELTLFSKNQQFKDYYIEKYNEEAVMRAFHGKGSIKASIAYKPSINEYMGRRSVQLIIEDYC